MQHEITCQQSENAEGNAEASESLFPLSATESLVEGQKRCAKCKTVKRLDEFHKEAAARDGLHRRCRSCCSDVMRRWYSNPENRAKRADANRRWQRTPEGRAKMAEAYRRYRQTPEGRAKHAEYKRRWREDPENRAKEAERYRRWRQSPENRAKQAEAARRWGQNPDNRAKHTEAKRRWRQSGEGRDWMAEYVRRRRKTDPQFRLALLIRRRLRHAIKGTAKSARTLELLGCSPERLIQHLESQFKPGMTWANQGEWHIDHITPLASFDLSDPEQQRMACHWSNLQPLWADENIRKGAKVLCEEK